MHPLELPVLVSRGSGTSDPGAPARKPEAPAHLQAEVHCDIGWPSMPHLAQACTRGHEEFEHPLRLKL
eukprot:6485435-Amphidinium_carterae.1